MSLVQHNHSRFIGCLIGAQNFHIVELWFVIQHQQNSRHVPHMKDLAAECVYSMQKFFNRQQNGGGLQLRTNQFLSRSRKSSAQLQVARM